MAGLDQAETRAIAALQRADDLIADAQPVAAIETLTELLTHRQTRSWHKLHDEIIRKLIRLCMEQMKHQPLRDAMFAYRRRAMLIDADMVKDKIEEIMAAAVQVVRIAIETAKNAPVHASNHFVHLMTGLDVEAQSKKLHVEKAVEFFCDVQRQMLSASRLVEDRASGGKFGGKQLIPTFNSVIKTGISLFVELGLQNELERFSNQVHRSFYENLLNNRELLETAMHSEESMSIVMGTKFLQLRAAAKLRSWRLAGNTIQFISDLWKRLAAVKKPVTRKLYLEYYTDVTQLFAACDMPAFHALCAVREARLRLRSEDDEEKELAASKAVLAALCVPASSDQVDSLTYSHDVQRDLAIQLAKNFSLQAPPTRTSLINDVTDSQAGLPILEVASDEVKAIFNAMVRQQSIRVCSEIKPALETIAAIDGVDRYIQPIKDAAVEQLLGVVARSYAKLPISRFLEMSAFYAAGDYRRFVEPVLLRVSQEEPHGTKIQVDLAHNALVFASATARSEERITEFALKLQSVAASCVEAPKKAPAAPKFSVAAIESETERIRIRMYLARARMDTGDQRADAEKAEEIKRKLAEQDRIKQAEEARHRRNLEQKEKKLLAEVKALEAVERRKWVIKAILAKNKNIDLPNKLADLDQDKFAEEITRRLANYRRETEAHKMSQVRVMDHLERAIREDEIPKRNALEEERAAKGEAERTERIKNLKAKHRADFDEAVETKQRLAKFFPVRQVYEDQVMEKAGKPSKETKRQAEQRRLEEEKRIREEAAAKETAEKEAAQAAPKETPAPAAPEAGKTWQPRHKREEASAEGAAAPAAAPAAAAKTEEAPKKWVPKHQRQ